MYAFAVQFALIKGYALPSGTALLVQTRRLASTKHAGKRSEDTVLILNELLVSGIDSDRGLAALSKMNWIHRQYGSKIHNGDMVYTLSLFILEPIRWINAHEWRRLSETEEIAIFTYWKEIGNRMGITDIPETIPAFEAWVEDFEAENMRYAESNRICTVATINLFLKPLPRFMQDFGKDVMTAFMEPRIRPLVGLDEPPWIVSAGVAFLFECRKHAIRHFFLPRLRDYHVLGTNIHGGRLQRDSYIFEPWYVRETAWTSLIKRLARGGDTPGNKYMSEGYLPEELGPIEYKERSREAVLSEAQKMKEYASKGGSSVAGCPFSFAP
ncbi:hypothetical protein B0O99DRAFT_531127 [Bisporella sp. PMI_857]|nr:hypothetical protein B0O99DRAFT_531127 [Bisporella sp. PMI_857]